MLHVLISEQEAIKEIPDDVDLSSLPQLTVILDSGSTGRAAASFAKHQLHLNVFVVWDKIHRLIRDIKLAAEKSAGGALILCLI